MRFAVAAAGATAAAVHVLGRERLLQTNLHKQLVQLVFELWVGIQESQHEPVAGDDVA
jgi:hypothetical protein